MAVNSSNTFKNHYLPILCHRMHLKNKQTKKKAFSLSPAYGFIWVISVWGTVEYPGVDVKDESCLFRALGLFSVFFFSATEVPENKQPVRSPPTCPFLRCWGAAFRQGVAIFECIWASYFLVSHRKAICSLCVIKPGYYQKEKGSITLLFPPAASPGSRCTAHLCCFSPLSAAAQQPNQQPGPCQPIHSPGSRC